MTDVILRPFGRADFARLIGWVPSAEFLVQWSGPKFSWPLDEAQLDAYAAEAAPAADAVGRRLIYSAADAASGEVFGHIELNEIDPYERSATIARVLIGPPELRGTGLGAAMVLAAMRIAFEDLGLHRLEIRAFDFNEAALRCYRRLGFVEEARFRDRRRVGDTYWTVVGMAMLEDEWRALT